MAKGEKKAKKKKLTPVDVAKQSFLEATKAERERREAEAAAAAEAEASAAQKLAAMSAANWRDVLRAGPGFDLSALDPSSTPGFTGKRADGEAELEDLDDDLAELQERFYAEGTAGGQRSVLLIIQGMDTSGKGGIMRHVVGAIDPQGVRITAFKAPTPEEKRYPFLWRIRKALPRPGVIGVFDRSHYEDVLIARVRDLVPRATWVRRYGQINTFEKGLAAKGTTVIKVMLHISKEEQGRRLLERLERPDKHWKYNPGDVDERRLWDDYQEAYQAALDKCSTLAAPWYVVPADKKWYAHLAVMHLLLETLAELNPQWPVPDFDVEVEKQRLAES